MSLVAHIRGLMGLQGANGVVGLGVYTLVSKAWTQSKANSALTFNAVAGTVTVNVAGWYCVNWSGAVVKTSGSTIALSSQGGTCIVAGPLT